MKKNSFRTPLELCLKLLALLLLIDGALTYRSNTNDRVFEARGNDDETPAEETQIGLFTDRDSERLNIVFEHAIEVANNDLNVLLKPLTTEVDYGDSFQAYHKLCRMLQRPQGIGCIFGPSSRHTAAHLTTVCDAKDVPYVYSSMLDNLEGFNLHPHYDDMTKAIHSILLAYDWTSFIFLYESSEYLGIVNGLFKLFGKNMPTMTVLRWSYNVELIGNYKTVLRRIRNADDNRILVIGSTESMPEFLRQAQQVGIINEDYKYIIGNLDFHSFDLEEYKYSEANITSFRAFSPEKPEVRELMIKLGHTFDEESAQNGSCPITMEMALLYDAVQLYAETSKQLLYKPMPLNCSERSDSVKDDGSTFRNYMRSLNLEERMMTGRIFFEGNVRKGYKFDVIELQPSGIVKVGDWDENNNFTVKRLAPTNSQMDHIDNSLANKTFIVLLSVPNKPYASIVESFKKLDGNSQYEGYSVDLIEELAMKLGFNYTFKNGGNDYGSFNITTNTSTGMLREIIEGRADLAVTDLTITSEREAAIDFSIPFMNLGIAILFKAPEKAQASLFSFMDAFSAGVWWLLALSFCLVSLSIFVLGRLSPVEWDNPCACIEEPTELKNQFTIGNAIWFATGAILQQGSDLEPKALSVRIVGVAWWFFTLLIISTYTANLAAFLTTTNPVSLIENVEELAENKDGVVYGSKKSGSTRNFFQTAEEGTYKVMNEFINSHPELLTATNLDGVRMVQNNDNYAFLMESTTIEYHTVRDCKLKKIGQPLDEKGYGIAMRKYWPYRDKFNNALLELQEQGVLAKMKNKWWNEIDANVCSDGTEAAEAASLNMENLGGVFFVLAVGSMFCLIFGIKKWIQFVKRKAQHYEVPFKQAFMEELKIVFDFQTHSRSVGSEASLFSQTRRSSANQSLKSVKSIQSHEEESHESKS